MAMGKSRRQEQHVHDSSNSTRSSRATAGLRAAATAHLGAARERRAWRGADGRGLAKSSGEARSGGWELVISAAMASVRTEANSR